MSTTYTSTTMALMQGNTAFSALPTSNTSLADLPTELHLQVLGYLGWVDLLSCEHVCRSWREVVRKITPSRYAVAPWLPAQTYAFAAYAPLQIHKFLTEAKKKTISYRCVDSYKIAPSPFMGEDDIIKPITCITSLNIIEKNVRPGEYLSSTPVKNLSILDEMIVLPALLYEDEITQLNGRFERRLPEFVRVKPPVQTSNDEDDDNDDQDEEGDENIPDAPARATNATQTTTKASGRDPMFHSSGTMSCSVAPSDCSDFDDNFSMLTLGGLLLNIRKSVIDTVFRDEGVLLKDTEGMSQKQADAQAQWGERRKRDLEGANIVVSGLHFERSGSKNRLAIVYDAMVIPQKDGREKKMSEAPVTIDTTKEEPEADEEEEEEEGENGENEEEDEENEDEE